MELDPAQIDIAARYKLLIGSVVPRPIALVSTKSPAGDENLAPFSFFTAVGSNPMTMLFCPANKPDGSEKDTLRNAKPTDVGGTGQFVVSVVSEEIVQRVAAAAEPLEYGQSEFDFVGLRRAPSRVVQPPRVAESPIAFECETTQIIRTNPDQPGGGNIVLGRVVSVFVRDDLINERMHVDPRRLRAIGRMGGMAYCRTGDRFDLPMGRAALDND